MPSKKQVTISSVGTSYVQSSITGMPDKYYIVGVKAEIKSGSGSTVGLRLSDRSSPAIPENVIEEFLLAGEIDERTDLLVYSKKQRDTDLGTLYIAAKVNTGSNSVVVITIEYDLEIVSSSGGSGSEVEIPGVFTTTEDGLVPAPVSATGEFLKDDGTWGTPGGVVGPDLTAIEALGGAGFPARVSSGTWVIRSLGGTTNRITVTDGAGTGDDPTVDIAATYAGQSSITTLGTITTGVWNGTDIVYANIQDVSATDRLLGRDTAGAGVIEELTVTGGLEFTGSGGIRRSALTGDITASAGSNATTLATVNSDVGTFTYATVTVNAKGLITAASSGTTPATASFTTIQVSGQSDVVADSATDTLTLIAGTNITITTNATNDSVTINSTGGSLADADYGDITVSASGTIWTIDPGVVSNAKFRDSAALSVVGRSANSTGSVADISTTAASDAVLRESGGTLGFGTVATAGIANDAITYAKLQDASTTQRILARNTAGAGDYEETTATQVLDWIGSTQGQILYRNATNWTVLSPGSAGEVLTSGGAAANPSWSTASGGLSHQQIMSRIALSF